MPAVTKKIQEKKSVVTIGETMKKKSLWLHVIHVICRVKDLIFFALFI